MGPKAKIYIQNLANNFSIIKKTARNAMVFPVVKANAYGHGITKVAIELEKRGADGFCVAHFEEIKALLDSDIKSDILYLGGLVETPEFLDGYSNIIYTISSQSDLAALNNGSKKRAHIKIDTGMNRLGAKSIDEVINIIEDSLKTDSVSIEGFYSHFASSDDLSSDFYKQQLDLFLSRRKEIISRFGSDFIFHIANSSAIFRDSSTHFNLVRPGLSLYGARTEAIPDVGLRHVMELKSYIVHTKSVARGESIGYNQKFIAKNDLMVGIVQVGYADGIFTDFMNVGEVVFDDKKLPIIGKVSMDTVCIDITSENVKKGDSVSIWGDPSRTITLESLSKKYNRIPYEYLTAISERVRKEYIYE